MRTEPASGTGRIRAKSSLSESPPPTGRRLLGRRPGSWKVKHLAPCGGRLAGCSVETRLTGGVWGRLWRGYAGLGQGGPPGQLESQWVGGGETGPLCHPGSRRVVAQGRPGPGTCTAGLKLVCCLRRLACCAESAVANTCKRLNSLQVGEVCFELFQGAGSCGAVETVEW